MFYPKLQLCINQPLPDDLTFAQLDGTALAYSTSTGLLFWQTSRKRWLCANNCKQARKQIPIAGQLIAVTQVIARAFLGADSNRAFTVQHTNGDKHDLRKASLHIRYAPARKHNKLTTI